MFTFTVNGKSVSTDKEEKLITFLREELLLTSVKNGCSEGACGTCTILIDGKATKACVQKTSKMEGRSVVTCEGLTERRRTCTPMPSLTAARSSAASAPPVWS
jgi:aerobic-type carbon monoxide dehydrogenase small subunit (CoxS/CutS family)